MDGWWDAYHAYIASPAWKAKRKEAFKYYGRFCALCKSTKRLHVDHLTYARLFAEPVTDLQVLCEECHSKKHKRNLRKPRSMASHNRKAFWAKEREWKELKAILRGKA